VWFSFPADDLKLIYLPFFAGRRPCQTLFESRHVFFTFLAPFPHMVRDKRPKFSFLAYFCSFIVANRPFFPLPGKKEKLYFFFRSKNTSLWRGDFPPLFLLGALVAGRRCSSNFEDR